MYLRKYIVFTFRKGAGKMYRFTARAEEILVPQKSLRPVVSVRRKCFAPRCRAFARQWIDFVDQG